MHLFCLLGDGWTWAIQVAGSVGCAPGELGDEGVLCRNTRFGPGTSAPDGAILLGWSSSGDTAAHKVR